MTSTFETEFRAQCKERHINPCPESVLACVAGDGQSLTLENYTIQPRIASALAGALQGCGGFRAVVLNNLFLGEEGCKEICMALRHSDRVEEVALTGHGLRDEHHGTAELLGGAPALRALSLEWNKLGMCPHALGALGHALIRHNAVRSLNLSNNLITPDGCRDLCFDLLRCKGSSLVSLDLSWNRLGNVGAQVLLDSLASNTTLCTLHVKGNNIDHALMERLQERMSVNELRRKEAEQQRIAELATRNTVLTLRSRETELVDTVRNREDTLHALQAQLDRSRDEIRLASGEAQSARQRLQDLQKMLEETQAFYLSREAVIVKDRDSANESLMTAYKQIHTLQQEVEKSHADARAKDEEHHRKEIKLQHQVDEMRRELKECHSRLEAMAASQRQGNADLETTSHTLSELRQEMITKEAKAQHMEEEVRRVTVDIKSRESQILMLDGRCTSLNSQITTLNERLARSEDEKNIMRTEYTRREVDLREKYSREKVDTDAQWSSRVREQDDSVRIKANAIVELERELEAVRGRHEKTMAATEETRRVEAEAHAKATLEIQRLNHTVSELNSEKRRMEHALQMAEARNTTLHSEVTELQRQHQTRIEELSSFNAVKVRDAEERVQHRNNQIQELERDRTKAMEDIRKMREERWRFHEFVEAKVMDSLRVALSDIRSSE